MSKSNYPQEFPCPVCGRSCEVSLTKKDKPYYMCELCGVQVFVRATPGIKRFAEFKDSALLKNMFGKNSVDSTELVRTHEKLELIENRVEHLKDRKPLFGNSEINHEIDELNKSAKELKDEYFQELKK